MRFTLRPTSYEEVQQRIERVRKEITEALFESGDDLLLTSFPGSGKSTLALRWAVETVSREGGAVVYVVPTHALAEELKQKVVGVGATKLEGRNEKNCRLFAEVKSLIEKGFQAVMLCRACPYEADCTYWKRFRCALDTPAQVVFCSPQLFTLALQCWSGSRAVVIDERIENLLHPEKTSLNDLFAVGIELKVQLPEVITRYSRKLAEHIKGEKLIYLSSKSESPRSLWKLLEQLGEAPQSLRDELELKLKEYDNPRQNWDLAWEWFEKGLSLKAYSFLVALLEGRAYVTMSRHGIVLSYYEPVRIPEEARLIAVDSSAIPRLAEAILGRSLRVIAHKVPLHHPVRLVKLSINKTSIETSSNARETLLRTSETVVRTLKPGNYLVFAFKKFLGDVEERLSRSVQERMKLTYACHYGSQGRGLNVHQDCRGVLVLGRPVQNPRDWLPKLDALGIPPEETGVILHELSYWEVVQEVCRLRPHLRKDELSIWLVGNFSKEKLGRYLDAKIEGGVILSALGLMVRLTEVCIKALGFADPLILRQLGINPPPLERRIAFWIQVSQVLPEKTNQLCINLQNLYEQEKISILLLSHSPDPIKIFIYSQESDVPRKSDSAQVVDSSNAYPHASVERNSPNPIKKKIGGGHSPNPIKEIPPLVILSWPIGISYGKDWYNKIRQHLTDIPNFPIRRRTSLGGWSSTYGLGDEEAFKAFYEALGLWDVEVELARRGLVFYTEQLMGGDDEG